MSDQDVGYGKPPKQTRFKPGVSGNPAGRPKRLPPALGSVIKNALDASVEYRERGRTQKTTRRDLSLKRHLARALEGDIGSAEALLKLRAQAQRGSGGEGLRVRIEDLLPDDAGQLVETSDALDNKQR